ncbi:MULTISPECIES: ABC transporter permease [unclassified Nocardioides]|uniref:ABC transporter permease n=1 Tax=unclassified Nocardioides TaxID=2615069 RepID=UPI0011522556|nr:MULTISPECIES: ABC transporter permease [unclassified Nocardioides]TQK70327.1 peptide/nickel transport system permease protein [Nocardioides sp. SLBN-35]WGY00270.1 ABC transporter permease [Nocardioides sp. QY071]
MAPSLLARYLARRLALLVTTLWGVVTIVFLLIKAIPGDEAQAAAGVTATPEQVEVVRQRLGLDESVLQQYLNYLGRLLHGDLGTSIFTFQPVLGDLQQLIPYTVELVGLAMVINLTCGVPLGVLAAARHRTRTDNSVRLAAIFCGALPTFWLAMIAQTLIGRKLGVVPISGVSTLGVEVPRRTGFLTVDSLLAGDLTAFSDALAHLVLPAAVLAIPFMSFVIRVVRGSMITALEADHVTAARAKGARERTVLLQHGLRNAIAPVSTLVGLQVGWMMGGAVMVETVFSRPGFGSYLTQAVAQKDTFAVIGMVLVVGVIVTFVGLLVDLVQLAADPRVRLLETRRASA